MNKTAFAILTTTALLLTLQSSRAGSATWTLSPPDNRWSSANNWTPTTVPNGSADTATFAVSNTTNISITAIIEVNGIVFDAGASLFTITGPAGRTFTLSGSGIGNNSGLTQSFVTNGAIPSGGEIHFTNSAAAGSGILFTNNGYPFSGSEGGKTSFFNTASAGNAAFNNNNDSGSFSPGSTNFFGNATAASGTFTNNGATNYPGLGGVTTFSDSATAGDATFINNPGVSGGGYGGSTNFLEDATAANATFLNNSAVPGGSYAGTTGFGDNSTAANAIINNKGGTGSGLRGGTANFGGTATAANSTIINEGGAVSGASGGSVTFFSGGGGGDGNIINDGGMASGAYGGTTAFSLGSTAGNSTLTANNGVDKDSGAGIYFSGDSTGGTARIKVFGSGTMFIADHDAPGVAVGSIEGNGQIDLGAEQLTVGTNHLSTTFSGRISGLGGGSLVKTGKGKLSLTSANNYTGSTRVVQGTLFARNTTGSATGTGPVQVAAGILGGTGIVIGPVSIGTGTGNGALLAPGSKVSLGALTVQKKLTFGADATYDFALSSSRIASDQVVAKGVTINGATLSLVDNGTATLPGGTSFTVINNTATTPIAGTFANLNDGAILTVGNNTFQASYEGGDGNDLTLTVVP